MSSPIDTYDIWYNKSETDEIHLRCLLQRSLKGRGHKSTAGFYRQTHSTPGGEDHEYLIKEDCAGVCLAEATATDAFLTEEEHKRSINCAFIGRLNSKVISIQEGLTANKRETLIGLDEYVYGRKRNPNTWRSEESRWKDKIKTMLSELPWRAKNDLASALFASTALGDESLHLGQFMIVTSRSDADRRIKRIIRVDFGARERFAKKRFETFDYHPTRTSKPYAHSGQKCKDYISYLLVDKPLRTQFLSLWAMANIETIVQSQILKFKTQIATLPDDKKEVALYKFLDEFNKGAKHPVEIGDLRGIENKIRYFLLVYEEIIRSRCEHMQKEAREELSQTLEAERNKSFIDVTHARLINGGGSYTFLRNKLGTGDGRLLRTYSSASSSSIYSDVSITSDSEISSPRKSFDFADDEDECYSSYELV